MRVRVQVCTGYTCAFLKTAGPLPECGRKHQASPGPWTVGR